MWFLKKHFVLCRKMSLKVKTIGQAANDVHRMCRGRAQWKFIDKSSFE